MNIKVSGLCKPDNIQALAKLPIDFMGFIFHESSPKAIDESELDIAFMKSLPNHIQKTGVFVDETFIKILPKVIKHNLQTIELHGDETPDLCRKLRIQGIEIIKCFRLKGGFDFHSIEPYLPYCDYFLFDYNGLDDEEIYDWSLIDDYPYDTPYFLRGGLTIDNSPAVLTLKNKPFAIDIDEGFENNEGLKDLDKIASAIKLFKFFSPNR